MLEIRGYDKEELIDIFHTDKTSNIQRTLRSQGYEFYTNGKRGKNFRLYITKTGDEFKIFCIEELGISAQADFVKIEYLMFFYFCGEDFNTKSLSEMERFLARQGIIVSRQTISKWLRYLEKKEILYRTGEFYYYLVNNNCGKFIYTPIDKDEYSKYWKLYWDLIGEGNTNAYAINVMRAQCGGGLAKVPKREINAFYIELMEKMIRIITQDDAFNE